MLGLLLVPILLLGSPARAQDPRSISELIDALGVQDAASITSGSASQVLESMGDEAVPSLARALQAERIRVRYGAVRCLAGIDTVLARKALLDSVDAGLSDVSRHAMIALTWHPHADAEHVYLRLLDDSDTYRVVAGINAAGEICSATAATRLRKFRDKPGQWMTLYASTVALRKIEGTDPTRTLEYALGVLRDAKYNPNVDRRLLEDSVRLLRAHLDEVLVDVLNTAMWEGKAIETKVEPNAKTLIRLVRAQAEPLIRVALADPDINYRQRAKRLLESIGWPMGGGF